MVCSRPCALYMLSPAWMYQYHKVDGAALSLLFFFKIKKYLATTMSNTGWMEISSLLSDLLEEALWNVRVLRELCRKLCNVLAVCPSPFGLLKLVHLSTKAAGNLQCVWLALCWKNTSQRYTTYTVIWTSLCINRINSAGAQWMWEAKVFQGLMTGDQWDCVGLLLSLRPKWVCIPVHCVDVRPPTQPWVLCLSQHRLKYMPLNCERTDLFVSSLSD